jgi:hypothetical protein
MNSSGPRWPPFRRLSNEPGAQGGTGRRDCPMAELVAAIVVIAIGALLLAVVRGLERL